jgi:DNA-binding CsgD family transcriptional regulator
VIEYLPSICKALGSIPQYCAKQKNRKKKKKRETEILALLS